MTNPEPPRRKAVRPFARSLAGHSGARSNAAFTTHNHTDLPPRTGPEITKTRRICAATPSHPAEPTALPISAVARPRQNPDS